MPRQNFYEVLELDQTATDSMIKKAYRRLALKYHPDKNADKTLEEQEIAKKKFQAIGSAYETLRDTREAYDMRLNAGVLEDNDYVDVEVNSNKAENTQQKKPTTSHKQSSTSQPNPSAPPGKPATFNTQGSNTTPPPSFENRSTRNSTQEPSWTPRSEETSMPQASRTARKKATQFPTFPSYDDLFQQRTTDAFEALRKAFNNEKYVPKNVQTKENEEKIRENIFRPQCAPKQPKDERMEQNFVIMHVMIVSGSINSQKRFEGMICCCTIVMVPKVMPMVTSHNHSKDVLDNLLDNLFNQPSYNSYQPKKIEQNNSHMWGKSSNLFGNNQRNTPRTKEPQENQAGDFRPSPFNKTPSPFRSQ